MIFFLLFSGSRDGMLKRWELVNNFVVCNVTFESHVDWVNDVILTGEILVSSSSDTILKTWCLFSDGVFTRTLHQHFDYVTCLTAT
jgi:WD repeat-containing protein 48